MFKNCKVFEITRPFWSHLRCRKILLDMGNWMINIKERECKGNRNDLIEKKIQNFIFVKKMRPCKISPWKSTWQLQTEALLDTGAFCVISEWSKIDVEDLLLHLLERAMAADLGGNMVSKYLSQLGLLRLRSREIWLSRVDNWELVLASDTLRPTWARQTL